MRIAIDYDNTYDRNPAMWNRFITDAISQGCAVWIVSSRTDNEENREQLRVKGCFLVLTSHSPKLWFCEQRGLNIDVWIDDDPFSITEGK